MQYRCSRLVVAGGLFRFCSRDRKHESSNAHRQTTGSQNDKIPVVAITSLSRPFTLSHCPCNCVTDNSKEHTQGALELVFMHFFCNNAYSLQLGMLSLTSFLICSLLACPVHVVKSVAWVTEVTYLCTLPILGYMPVIDIQASELF